jgi:hypothetical protein
MHLNDDGILAMATAVTQSSQQSGPFIIGDTTIQGKDPPRPISFNRGSRGPCGKLQQVVSKQSTDRAGYHERASLVVGDSVLGSCLHNTNGVCSSRGEGRAAFQDHQGVPALQRPGVTLLAGQSVPDRT